MKVPDEQIIGAVISELDSDDCDKKTKHVCESCDFVTRMADRSSEDHPSAFDKFLLDSITRCLDNDPPVALAITIGGPGMIALFRMIAFHSFLIGYKTRNNEQVASELHDLMNKE